MTAVSENVETLIIGSGVSGSFIAMELAEAGREVLVLEAGEHFTPASYPKGELDGNGRLYWGGGIELNTEASLGLLRAKAVGGGSIVNQALVDRFDEVALEDWRNRSGIEFLSTAGLALHYERAEGVIAKRSVPRENWNRNARIFEAGFEKLGYRSAPLRRAQGDCRWEEGNDCIVCLNGCPIDSKQSMPVTALKRALAAGARLESRCEVERIVAGHDGARVYARGRGGPVQFGAKRLVLAAGALGNTRILLESRFGARLPALGRGFHTHPQYMVFAEYDEPVEAFRGPFQGVKSDEPRFRAAGFKLENVFAPPVGIAMLLPAVRHDHRRILARLRNLACIEVAVRDTAPGTISVGAGGKIRIEKRLNAEDRRRRDAGLKAVDEIFRATGATAIHRGTFPISLHLMGGCAIGRDGTASVVGPDFRVHGTDNVWIADSSVFPSAPGINPSLTVMALALKAADHLKEAP